MHINKCDTLCVFDDFSKEAVEERIHKLNPKAEVIFVSAKTGEGFESWAESVSYTHLDVYKRQTDNCSDYVWERNVKCNSHWECDWHHDRPYTP